MVVPAVDELLEELDQDTHGGRVGRLARLGRDERGTAPLEELLDRLCGLGGYWHELALVAAVAAGDGRRVLAGVTAPAAGIRSFAWSHLIEAGVDVDALVAAAAGASAVDRGRLVRAIVRARRSDLAEQLLPRLRSRYGDREAARLLPACGDAMVVALLPVLDHVVSSWRVLASRHPGPVLDHLGAQLAASRRSQRDQLWRLVRSGIAVAVETRPEQVLVLLENFGPSGGPSFVLDRHLGRLLEVFPSRTVSLLLRPEHRRALVHTGLPEAVLKAAGVLLFEDRLALARAVRENQAHVAQLLSRVPPSQREALFRSTYADVDTRRTFWSWDVLEALPHAVRAGEAARMLALREVADDQATTLFVTSFLPIVEARPRLEQAATAAKAEERATAYRLLVDCTRRSRSPVELGITLHTLLRLRNEQDPVRLSVANGLVKISPGLFDDGHLDDLSQLIIAVVEARDSSPATIAYLRHLLVRFLALHPASSPAFAAALAGLDRLAGPSGAIAFGDLLHRLPRGAERPLLAALLPRMRREADRDRFDL